MLHPGPLIKGRHSVFLPCSLFSQCFLAEVLVAVTVFLFTVPLVVSIVVSLKPPRMRGKGKPVGKSLRRTGRSWRLVVYLKIIQRFRHLNTLLSFLSLTFVSYIAIG